MTNVFAVVGEHRTDRRRLLLRGDDGYYYAYGKTPGEVFQVRPGGDWLLDSDRETGPHEDERGLQTQSVAR